MFWTCQITLIFASLASEVAAGEPSCKVKNLSLFQKSALLSPVTLQKTDGAPPEKSNGAVDLLEFIDASEDAMPAVTLWYSMMNTLFPESTKAGADSAKAEASLHQQDTGASATSLLEVGVHHHPILAFVLGSHLDSPGKIYYGDKEGMAWTVFGGIFVALAAFDLQFLAPGSNVESVSGKTALCHCIFWLIVGILFNIGIMFMIGAKAAEVWFNGYILEYLLSMDNVFFFHVIFTTYATPKSQTYKALYLGILGAVVLRLIFYFVGERFFKLAFAVQVFFGLVLVLSGFKTATADEDDEDPREMCCVQFMSRNLPLTPTYHDGGALFVHATSTGAGGDPATPNVLSESMVAGANAGTGKAEDEKPVAACKGDPAEKPRLRGTMLLLVVLVLQVVDLIFAVDSVTAKIAEYDDIFINFSSSAFAMLCLRSMYFVLKGMLKYFRFLKYGVAMILVAIGVKLIVNPWFKIPEEYSLAGICGVFLFSMILSAIFPANDEE